jgi:hypothetical protein
MAVLLATGCATAPKVPVHGRTVTVVTEREGEKVKGELLTVGSDSLWVRASEGVVEVPLPSVREVRVQRHGFDKSEAFKWALIGGLATGGGMAGACATVDGADGCGWIGLGFLGAWLLVGAVAAPSIDSSSRLDLWRPTPERLRAFARLPQGWPESLRAPTLGPPAKAEAGSGPRPSGPVLDCTVVSRTAHCVSVADE